LENIANVEHFVPRDWIDVDGFLPNEKFLEYVAPLIVGEPKLPILNGLPNYVTLSRVPVDKVLPPR
jgi:6-phosphofructokinase 1